MDKQKTLLEKFKEKPFWDKAAIIAVIIALTTAISYNLIKDSSISKYRTKTIAKIVDFKHINKTRYSIIYEYEVLGESYNGQVGVRYFDCYKSRECIDYEVDVFYSSKNPKFSQVDLKKFEEFKTTIYLIK